MGPLNEIVVPVMSKALKRLVAPTASPKVTVLPEPLALMVKLRVPAVSPSTVLANATVALLPVLCSKVSLVKVMAPVNV